VANLTPVKRVLRGIVRWVERRALAQVHAEIGALDQRLDALDRRLAQMQAALETTAARSSASAELSQGFAESEARAARRIDAIEELLGARPPGGR